LVGVNTHPSQVKGANKNNSVEQPARNYNVTKMDGKEFDSAELDGVYRICYWVHVEGKKAEDLPHSELPVRLQGKDHDSWRDRKDFYRRVRERYRLIRSDDPEQSHFMKKGRFGCRNMTDKEVRL